MLSEMTRELSFHDNVKFIYKEAKANSQKQIEQIKELVNEKIDLLIVSPNEVKPLSPIIEKVYRSGVPVVVVDRRTGTKDYTAFVGASNFEVGQNAGRYAEHLLNGKGNVMEVTGIPDASPVIDRHNGFIDIISHYPAIHYVNKIENYISGAKENPVYKYLKKQDSIDLIYAQNDFMAYDVYKICKQLGLDNKIKIIGIDGLPLEGAGLDMVANKYISATVLYPTGGQEAMLTAFNILENKPYRKENQLYTTIIDSSNVRIMKLQSQKILAQQNNIEVQQNILNEQIRIYNNQRTFNNILAGALLLVVLLGTTVFIAWRKNKKITKKIQAQNEEILGQSNQLIEMSLKTEEAHQARLNFFTNISHEFRTPLTLIFAPLGELIANNRIQQDTRQTLQLIQRNVMRLYRLVTQLMDFRKIEFKKMKPHVSETDLVTFTKEIVDSFKVLAKNKNINLEFITSERSLFVWIDITMIDKVIFNILSNAFKFTNDHGFIHITISRNTNNALIKLEDDGIGMTKEVIDHAFEPFFQGQYENYKGTGLGLALSRELMEFHHGSIKITSQKKIGSTFEISLPLGSEHFEQSEFETNLNKEIVINEYADIYTTDLYNINNIPAQSFGSVLPKYLTLLLIEDNNEMRDYLTSRLGTEYNIIEAADGNIALKNAFDSVPDLILCDIVIPGKNGLELTQIFKSDVRTSHIPVILLTAKDQETQKIEGMDTQADAYITKPFNLLFLQKTIKSLLENREKIKDHYSGEIFSEEKSLVSKKVDRKFMIEFTAIVENNISNEKFGVNDICNELGISRIQLYRKVKAVLNCNVNNYIITTRLQKAKYYMQHENLSISEIAFKSGFSSAAYFATVFKSKFGVTPSAFKEN
ncbi:MAG: substrate-binding domain-containing protein [Bacteroidota bacterium]|nr:substrate-binding domain-containing protein [Bacteroidota bacterium]